MWLKQTVVCLSMLIGSCNRIDALKLKIVPTVTQKKESELCDKFMLMLMEDQLTKLFEGCDSAKKLWRSIEQYDTISNEFVTFTLQMQENDTSQKICENSWSLNFGKISQTNNKANRMHALLFASI